MRRILFIDDETAILRAMERTLRPLRHEWECRFADNPLEALDVVDSFQPDAVVSDMLMPDLDGAEFLSEAARRQPVMARVILSGEVDAGSLVRMAASAHQCLAKPCRGDVLIGVVRSALPEEGIRTPDRAPACAVQAQWTAGLVCIVRGGAPGPWPRRPATPETTTSSGWSADRRASPPSSCRWRRGRGWALAHGPCAYAMRFTSWARTPSRACSIRRCFDRERRPMSPCSSRRRGVTASAPAPPPRPSRSAEGLHEDAVDDITLVTLMGATAPLLLDALSEADYEVVRLDARRLASPGTRSSRSGSA